MEENKNVKYITEIDLFTQFVRADKTVKSSSVTYSAIKEILYKDFELSVNSLEFENVCEKTWKRYKRLKEKHFKKNGYAFILSQASKDIIYEVEDACITEPCFSKQRKSFTELGDKMKKERTQELLNYINKFITNECPELHVNQLLGYLLHRVNTKNNKSIARVGNAIFTNHMETIDIFSIDESIALMHSLTLSKEQMRKLRFLFASKGIYFPTTNELLEGRKKLRPTISNVLTGRGVSVQYKELVKMTIDSVLNIIKDSFIPVDGDEYQMCFKDGCDGAGQQVSMKSKEMIESKSNIFQYGLIPLKLICHRDSKNMTLWQNYSPNASRSLRPVFLIRETETNQDLLDLIVPTTDNAREELNAEGMCCLFGKNYINVKIYIQDTMKDLKFKRLISGLGGADCILCKTKTTEWTDIRRVSEGFPIDRSSEETWMLYEKLVNKDGIIPTKTGDFATRKGLTKKPQTKSDQKSICITHSYINSTTWFLKLLYRCHIDYRLWVTKTGPLGEPIRNAKDRVITKIKENTGLRLDMCCNSGEKGGTSTTGSQGRRFFSEELISSINDLCSPMYKDSLLLLHSQISIILRIVSCQRKIKIDKFQELCNNATLNIITNMPWAQINHTLHGVLHHSADLITLNDGYGLGNLSEEGLEANNKDIRNYLKLLSRKTSHLEQLTDVMSRLLERSDPCILNQIIHSHPPKLCEDCGSNEHTSRSHERMFSKPKRYFDDMLENLIYD